MGVCGKIDRGLVFVVSAPAGAGKTTLVEMLMREFPNEMIRSVSCTTRKPRQNEVKDKDYIFLTLKEFEEKIHEEAFLEYAKVFSNYYGTLKKTIEDNVEKGKHVFLVIDTQGACYLKNKIKAFFIFIMPPSINELEKRLKIRHTETNEKIKERLSWAKDEIKKSVEFDIIIENKDLKTAYGVLKDYITKMEKINCKYLSEGYENK